MRSFSIFCLLLVFLASCTPAEREMPLFQNVAEESGIRFSNNLTYTERLNPYTYRNFYNGAGVALGDINNDGLLDIYFAGNQVGNKLYLNQGNFTFLDITDSAGVACDGAWSSGVTLVDINADGWLDIYVCKSGDPESPNRANSLFINNKDLTFTEQARAYGLDIQGLSVQAAFFDYDKDGDLDCYLLTNSFKPVGAYDLVKDQREIPDPMGGNKFLLNQNGQFMDYTRQAGIYSSNIGFGLGITLGDFNKDGWVDIFVSNDFFERDYLYINNRQGAFKESLTDYFSSISMGSMGADFADLNNDGRQELFVTEMLPDSLHRRKSKTVFETWDKYQLSVQSGYHHQFSRNVLQTPIGDGKYVEVGRLAGIAATEWSWGTLLFDMDNDGLRDIFVANGIYKDLLDRDYLTYTASEENVITLIQKEKNPILKLIDQMPTSSFSNYAFKNEGDFQFTNMAAEWGLDVPQFSSGSAFGDLDNDGDLDLVLNNLNAPTAIYRNNTDTSVYKSITLLLHDRAGKNTYAVGSHVTAYINGVQRVTDNFVTRGFQSSVQPSVTVGLGKNVRQVDSLRIIWPDGTQSMLRNLPANQQLTIDKSDLPSNKLFPVGPPWQAGIKLSLVDSVLFVHRPSGLVDFNRDRLLPMMYSNETPFLAKADVNGDGEYEVYVGGGKDQSGILLELRNGYFSGRTLLNEEFDAAEETKILFFDADGDGDLDFYQASGGRFYPGGSSLLMDHLFLNDGRGGFSPSPDPLPFTKFISTSVVKALDVDQDGDMDLFVGERFDPFVYGKGGRGYLLLNDGRGRFTESTARHFGEAKNLGMVTDAVVTDLNADGWADLVVVGDWMPVLACINNNGKLEPAPEFFGKKFSRGWWHTIETHDLNSDGVPDFILGNNGQNSFFREGDRMYVSDFDGNGSVEQIFCTAEGGKYYPIADKDDFLSQLPSFKKQLIFYKQYSRKPIDALVPASVLSSATSYQVDILASYLLLSSPNGYRWKELPREAQFSPIYSLLVYDFDGDSTADILAAGNHYAVKPQFGRMDGSRGWFFKGKKSESDYSLQKGITLNVSGQIRDMEIGKWGNNIYLFFSKHGSNLEVYQVNR